MLPGYQFAVQRMNRNKLNLLRGRHAVNPPDHGLGEVRHKLRGTRNLARGLLPDCPNRLFFRHNRTAFQNVTVAVSVAAASQ